MERYMRTEVEAQAMPRVCVVGPLPPPSGGMANQCEQLVRLLRAEGLPVEIVRNNAPYRPAWIGSVPLLRAAFRLLPYLAQLWSAAGRSQVLHVLANSGWAWHLFAAPALLIARLRRTAVIVNYRGGLADTFLSQTPAHVRRSLRAATMRVTPSTFLQRVFERHGIDAEVIPNIIDLSRFKPRAPQDHGDAPHLIVVRNLERLYDIATALRALVIVRERYPRARMTVAGSGPEHETLVRLARDVGVADAVHFTGRVEHAQVPAIYAQADVALNPSLADNMPNSVLEAYASGVPVVSTNVGGVPDIVVDGVSGLLVPPGDPAAMALAVVRLLDDRNLAARLVQVGLGQAQRYAWPQVKGQWFEAYLRCAAQARGGLR
jgi:glycosyltransferase involved in cell wall biosynthesis